MRRITRAVAVCMVALVAVGAGPALAAEKPAAKTNRIRISYVPPKNPAHQPIYDRVKEARVLEKLQGFLSPLRLPHPLLLKFEGCDGVSNAWYEEGAVTVCYEYLDDIWKAANVATLPPAISRRAALVGPLVDVFLHETGHALFEIFQIPLFGREEDAADGVSAYVQLQFPKEEARELIAGTAYSYATDLKLTSGKDLKSAEVTQKLEKFADEHGTPAQRLYNLLCVAYGADPKLFADVVEKGLLPQSRAEGCEFDYQQVAFAYRALISPHVDPKLAKKVRGEAWLQPAAARPLYRSILIPVPVAPAKRP